MKPLKVELVRGKPTQFQSIGWKSPREGDCRRQFFAALNCGRPAVFTLRPALPEYLDPLNSAKSIFVGEPFPEAICIEISPCRLLPPPCYQSREEFDGQFPGMILFDPWQAIYFDTHGERLILEPSDDGPLQERLDQWLAEMRHACQVEAEGWRIQIKRVKRAKLQDLGFDSEQQRSKRLGELQAQLDMVESEEPIDGMPCKGRLKLTLEAVKQGQEGIRDAWLHEQWAKQNGEDLALMARERRTFCRWLEKHTGTPARIFNATTRERVNSTIPPGFGEKYERRPKFLEACASVRYRARFSDNVDTTVYLADCELREELTAGELDEVAKLTDAVSLQIQAPARPDDTSVTPPRSPEIQFEYVNVQGTEWRKTGPHMVRRSQLAEHQRTTRDASSFRKLLEIHKERWFYPAEKIDQIRQATENKGRIAISEACHYAG